MLKGKKVKTNDGKDIGEIKQVSQNFLRLEKGTVKKDKFWIPKYVAIYKGFRGI
jgi:sporulation protein YlmC with PRC-barrel domain